MRSLKYFPYSEIENVDHSRHREEICFLKEVNKKPEFPAYTSRPEKVIDGVWDAHFTTGPDDRWEGSPQHNYRVRYYLPGADPYWVNFKISWEWNSDSLRRDPFTLEGKDGKFFYHKKPCPSHTGSTRELTREEMVKYLKGFATADLRCYFYDDPPKVVSREARAILTHLNEL